MNKVHKKLVSFTTTTNEVFKHNLSLRAIGLYVYILSKPDHWHFSTSGTSTQVKEKRDAINATVNELITAGFMRRIPVREKGKFTGYDWEITDNAFNFKETVYGKTAKNGSKSTEKPFTEKPYTVKHLQVNTNKVNTKEVVNKLTRPKATKLPNADINELLAYLKEKLELPQLDKSQQLNRRYAWNLLRKSKTGVDGVKWLIDFASDDAWWHDHITSMADLWNNQVKIMAAARNKRKEVAVYGVDS